ncbi:MAG TPA: glycerophosphodiester phosphodiesterase [Gemmatimonadales bacterium]|nr:glycerophosphodiester phosphodiesterase [Gemmatimonadales bacterium]
MNPLLDPGRRLVIGHRGASAEAPENTLQAFHLALSQGATALELDVRLAADGVPVVMHDALLDRTTDLSGEVAARTSGELAAADAGARFSPDGGRSYPWRGRGVRVSRLAEVLEEFRDVPLIIEIKEVAAQGAVRSALLEQRAEGRCIVAADDHRALEVFESPPFARGASRRDIARLFIRSLLPFVGPGSADCRSYAVPDRFKGLVVPSRRFIRLAGQAGCTVHVWTVNEVPTALRLWDAGANGIITDRPREMALALASRGA